MTRSPSMPWRMHNDSRWARVGKESVMNCDGHFAYLWGRRWLNPWLFEQSIGPPGREKTWCQCLEPSVTFKQKFPTHRDTGGCVFWGGLVPTTESSPRKENCLAMSSWEVMLSLDSSRWPWPRLWHDIQKPSARELNTKSNRRLRPDCTSLTPLKKTVSGRAKR